MLKDVTLGQYFPGNSIIHRMDPRAKLVAATVYIVAIFCASNILSFAALLLSSLLLILFSRIPIMTVLRGLKAILFILIFTAVINIFLTREAGEPLWQGNIQIFSWVWQPTVYRLGLLRALFMAIRVITLIIGTSIFLTYTTSPITLTDAIEDVLAPLKLIRIPVHDFAMIMTIALRFIPTLIEETEKIMNAQKARGADFESGSLVRRVKALVPVFIPLFVSAFKRAEDLAVAMECRCYRGGKGRTKLHKLQFTWRDAVVLLVMAAFLTGIFLLNHYNFFAIGL